jgi:DNA-binding response OmpR family regulator
MTRSRASKKEKGRILVLEPEEQLASSILGALHEAAPGALVEVTHNLEEAQRLVLGVKPDLFVLDVDAAYDLGQEFLYDLRTSHPNARAIILTGIHLPAHREQAAGLGAIHFLEKPFPYTDFVDLVHALLRPSSKAESEKFQGTLRDLHIADIIQLKCISGATSVLEFTGPNGQKARVFFEKGQVRHATTSDLEGLAAFNEIVGWRGGTISEVSEDVSSPRTIDLDWQVLLMEAARKLDEKGAAAGSSSTSRGAGRKILAIDDSLMLLSFVQEVLIDANYDVTTAATGEESLRLATKDPPDLILLDYMLPDMKGDQVCRKLLENPATAAIPVLYMSGFGPDLQPEKMANPNVIGFLNKPFTSDLLIKTVENHMSKSPEEPELTEPHVSSGEEESAFVAESVAPESPLEQEADHPEPPQVEPEQTPAEELPWWSAAPPATQAAAPANLFEPQAVSANLPDESLTGGAYFCGDTRFFSLNRAVQTIAKQKLTGSLRSFWNKEPVELLAQSGQIMLVTTHDPELYCPEAPVTLLNVDAERVASARDQQRETGCPLFLTLAQENLVLQETAAQLLQHHGQKLFAELWTEPVVRFVFNQGDLPPYTSSLSAEAEVDHWALATLRMIQFQELGNRADYDAASIPAYTKDGYDRVQNLRLTVAEAQFASQFNGSRSLQQIAKNLRLDLKFARLTLFRFLALEIVECWSASTAAKTEGKSVFQRLARSIGVGE